jgi:ribonuclease BN (tRNA processing enzyme)
MSSARLRLDFYESGVGETIVITFPSGGLGLVDAHPSQHSDRPNIRDIVKGKNLHFVCLTHPHSDHGIDLVSVLEEHPNVAAFWHTIFEIPALIYGAEQTVNFPSSLSDFGEDFLK